MTECPVLSDALLRDLTGIAGRRHVILGPDATLAYRRGFRSGAGAAACVVRPGTLLEFWHVLERCVAHDLALIVQAANTGLTGGSTPDPAGYDRPVVIINVMRIRSIVPIHGGDQVVCFPGATLNALEQMLRPLGREPHSVIGSSCFGASVIGGVCNNSGGSLVRRGVAYTQCALFARSTPGGGLELVNHLGIDLGNDPVAMLERLDRGDFDHRPGKPADRAASDTAYARQVRQIDADTPARHNADPRCLFEASGSAGKLAVFAVRLDTFPLERATRTFHIGCNDPASLADLRRTLLRGDAALPIAAEYMHAEAFDIADRYGKDQFLLIERLGTDRLPAFFALKTRLDAFLARQRWLPANMVDRLLHAAGRLSPDHLPKRLRAWRARFAHHLLLKIPEDMASDTRTALARWQAEHADADVYECTEAEARKAFLHRFVTAGAAARYEAIHPDRVAGILPLDIALRRNDRDWFETLPPEIASKLVHRIYYGHFLCHVLHQDYIVAKGEDVAALKNRMLEALDVRGARYPAEHNVGHMYRAPPVLADFYRSLDPANCFNPGIGHTSPHRDHAAHG